MSYKIIVMDAKITLSFDKQVIERAKKYAEKQNMSLSRLLEVLLDKITAKQYPSLDDYTVSDWVHTLAEGKAEYSRKTNSKKSRAEFRERKSTKK